MVTINKDYLNERINLLKQKGFKGDLEKKALEDIQNEYDYWVNNRTIISKRTDDLLNMILEGHTLNEVEGYEMICDDKEKIKSYKRFNALRKKVLVDKNINKDEFSELCGMMSVGEHTKTIVEDEYIKEGIICK